MQWGWLQNELHFGVKLIFSHGIILKVFIQVHAMSQEDIYTLNTSYLSTTASKQVKTALMHLTICMADASAQMSVKSTM